MIKIFNELLKEQEMSLMSNVINKSIYEQQEKLSEIKGRILQLQELVDIKSVIVDSQDYLEETKENETNL